MGQKRENSGRREAPNSRGCLKFKFRVHARIFHPFPHPFTTHSLLTKCAQKEGRVVRTRARVHALETKSDHSTANFVFLLNFLPFSSIANLADVVHHRRKLGARSPIQDVQLLHGRSCENSASRQLIPTKHKATPCILPVYLFLLLSRCVLTLG